MIIETVTEKQHYLKLLLYGDPGVGKTTLAATFPDPVFMDWDRGTQALLQHPQFADVRVAKPVKFDDGRTFLQDVARKKIVCGTVVIDTMTEMQNKFLTELADTKHAKEPTVYDEDVNTLPDYNKATNAIYKILYAYRELPVNLVIIAHAREVTEKDTGAFKIRPDLTPRLANIVCGMMDLVGYYQINEDKKIEAKRTLTVSPARKLVAKNRIGLPGIVLDPTYQSLNGKKGK